MPPQNTNQNDFSLEEKLRTFDSKDLFNLLQTLMNEKPENRRLILEWLKGKSKEMKDANPIQEDAQVNGELLLEYWGNAQTIISEFNEYGGGLEEEEDEVYEWFSKISKLIQNGNISTKTKFEFLDEAFVEYDINNSGFEDGMRDIFFEICKTREEWEYLVKKFGEQPTDWRKKQIMEIQKKYLQDENAYLKIRVENLHYGLDYWDLIEFYIKKGELQNALNIAEDGILNGDGRLTELFQFLFDHFAKKEDTTNLKRIVHTALTRKTEEKEMLDKLFGYYKAQDDYANAKEATIKAYEFVRHEEYYEDYNKMKEFLKHSDWEQVEPRIFKEVREKNICDYLRICLDKNMKEEVLRIILNPPKNQWGFAMNDEGKFDEFADKLKKDFPDRVIKYYWQKAHANFPPSTREIYHIAAGYLAKVKEIYTNILNDDSKWRSCFSDLKTKFKNYPAFLDEVKML